ncbi:MAG: membrane dipeptidase [Caldisphaeraceae archaeon]|nr:membrane dipeptidase [Caldisphaeraceae archaeon]
MKIVDLHEDIGYFSMLGNDLINGSFQSDFNKLRKVGEPLIFSAIFPAIKNMNKLEMDFHCILKQAKYLYKLEKEGLVKLVRKKSDLNEGNPIKFLISLEGTDPLTDPSDIIMLKEMGIRAIGLTWNYSNKFSSSCMSRKDYGLTDEGEELIRLANELGIIIDLAHASKQTTIDVANLSKKPVIVSHTAYRRLKNHRRNLDDDEIEAVIKTNGVVGIMVWDKVLPEATLEGYLKVINELGETYGWDYISIGTDFLGIESPAKGLENILSLGKIAEPLKENAEKVLWKNAFRVINQVID